MLVSTHHNSGLAGDPFPVAQLDNFRATVDKCLRDKLIGAELDCHYKVVQSSYGPPAWLQRLDARTPTGDSQYFYDPVAKLRLVNILAQIATEWRDIRQVYGTYDHANEVLGRRRATEQLLQYFDELTADTILGTLAQVLNQEADTETVLTAISGIRRLILSRFELLPNFVTIALTALQGRANELEPNDAVRTAARAAQAKIAAKTASPMSPAPPAPPPDAQAAKAKVIIPVALATLGGLALIYHAFNSAPTDPRPRPRSRPRSW